MPRFQHCLDEFICKWTSCNVSHHHIGETLALLSAPNGANEVSQQLLLLKSAQLSPVDEFD